MAKNVSGQHMRFQPMKSNAMSHNHRLKVPSYVHSDKSDLNVVYVQTDKRELTKYVKEVKADYQENVGRRYQDNFTPLWETLIVVNDDTKDKDIEKAINLIEEKTGLKIVDAVRHKDEGHYDKDGEWIANDHVHLIAKRYDFETHRHVVLDVQQIRELRKEIADTLGIAYTQTKEGEKPQKNISHHKYREIAQQGEIVELQKELNLKDYSLKEMQKRIVELEISAEDRKELHAQNRDINKTKDEEEKEKKYAELELKIQKLEDQLSTAQYKNREKDYTISVRDEMIGKQSEELKENERKFEELHKKIKIVSTGPFIPEEVERKIKEKDNVIDTLKKENEELKTAPKETQIIPDPELIEKNAELIDQNQKLSQKNIELSQTVETMSEEIKKMTPSRVVLSDNWQQSKKDEAAAIIEEQIKEIEEINLAAPNTNERNALEEKLRKPNALEEIKKGCYKRVEEKGVIYTTTKTVLDKDEYIEKLENREKDHQKLHYFNDDIIDNLAKKIKNVVERSKSGLKHVFEKIMGKSLPEVQKEREALLNKPRGLSDAVQELSRMKRGMDLER